MKRCELIWGVGQWHGPAAQWRDGQLEHGRHARFARRAIGIASIWTCFNPHSQTRYRRSFIKTSHHLTNVTVSFPGADRATVDAYVQGWHWKTDNTVVVGPMGCGADPDQRRMAHHEGKAGHRRRGHCQSAFCAARLGGARLGLATSLKSMRSLFDGLALVERSTAVFIPSDARNFLMPICCLVPHRRRSLISIKDRGSGNAKARARFVRLRRDIWKIVLLNSCPRRPDRPSRGAADENFSIERSADFCKGQRIPHARNLNLAGVPGARCVERCSERRHDNFPSHQERKQ
jgi:SnoaL-like domain